MIFFIISGLGRRVHSLSGANVMMFTQIRFKPKKGRKNVIKRIIEWIKESYANNMQVF